MPGIKIYEADGGITELTQEEAATRFGMTKWTHAILNSSQKSILGKRSPEWTKLLQESINTEQKMALVSMPAPCEGYEAIALERIFQGSILIYSGNALNESSADDPYLVGSSKREELVSARKSGNISRFISHAPTELSLQNEIAICNDLIVGKIATENFEADCMKISGIKFIILKAKRDIEVGEKVYWDYGLEHFKALDFITPLLFNKDTKDVIPPQDYYWKNLTIIFYNPNNLDTPYGAIRNVRDIIASDAVASLELKKYTLFLHARYLLEILQAQPVIRANGLYIKVPLPTKSHPYLKALEDGASTTLDIAFDEAKKRFFGKNVVERWLLTSSEEQISEEYVFSRTRELRAYRIHWETAEEQTFFQERLIHTGLKEMSDYYFDRDKNELCIFQHALFRAIHSSVEYCRELAEKIYSKATDGSPVVWKMTTDKIWLALSKTLPNQALLEELKAHICCHIMDESIRSEIKIEPTTNGKHWILYIPSSVLQQWIISSFVPSVSRTEVVSLFFTQQPADISTSVAASDLSDRQTKEVINLR